MALSERTLIAEQGKLAALRERIRQTTYMTAAEVRKHLHMSRDSLDVIPFEVLPWVPGNGGKRVVRRYHPADVAAYPARARRWRAAMTKGTVVETLAAMRAELEERDAKLIADALDGHAA